ncbi:hypothetical protein B9Z19DRAFT_1121761 [Tuber borchii]|uniref:Catalase core domain-containing protein n=1 Tax=Tuber borchii TaxID=42251 RepID=A0A2T7A215_TUBBO|nr:hypothetical protein B9Z19DRAFT_1121761 [Tuber borchii]
MTAQDLVIGHTEYELEGNSHLWLQKAYTTDLLNKILKANQKTLKGMKLSQSYRLGRIEEVQKGDAMKKVLETAVLDPLLAWDAFNVLLGELGLPGRDFTIQERKTRVDISVAFLPRNIFDPTSSPKYIEPYGISANELIKIYQPPVLFTLDNLNQISIPSKYRDPAFNVIHSHDLALPNTFLTYLSGKPSFHKGITLAATSSKCSRTLALDAALEGREVDPYERLDPRIGPSIEGAQIIHVDSLSKEEAKALMEYCTPYPDSAHCKNVGGVPVLSDQCHLEKLQRFNRSNKPPGRVAHSAGSGACGYFECTKDMSELTKADLYNRVKKRTPIFMRFSTAFLGKESPDQGPSAHGFAIKHCTKDGNYDIVGLNWPIFFCRDSMQGPDVFQSQRSNSENFLDYNATFDFLASVPESGEVTSKSSGNPSGQPIQPSESSLGMADFDPGAGQEASFFSRYSLGPEEIAARITGVPPHGKRKDDETYITNIEGTPYPDSAHCKTVGGVPALSDQFHLEKLEFQQIKSNIQPAYNQQTSSPPSRPSHLNLLPKGPGGFDIN